MKFRSRFTSAWKEWIRHLSGPIKFDFLHLLAMLIEHVTLILLCTEIVVYKYLCIEPKTHIVTAQLFAICQFFNIWIVPDKGL